MANQSENELAKRAFIADVRTESRTMESPEKSDLVIGVFAAGGVGEIVQSIAGPWEPRFEGNDTPAHRAIAERMLQGWSEMGDAWRLVAIIDGARGRALMGLGQFGEIFGARARTMRTVPWYTPTGATERGIVPPQTLTIPKENETQQKGRWLVVLLVSGAAGDRCRAVRIKWRDAFGTPGEEETTLAAVRNAWIAQPRHWRFAAAIDGATSRIIVTPTLMGQIDLLRGAEPIEERSTAPRRTTR